MAGIVIYHNGECSKSKGALELLQDEGVKFDVRLYITDSLSADELSDLLRKLKLQPSELVRKNESVVLEKYSAKPLNEQEWLQAMVDDPVIIERPIVEMGEKAIIARPPDLVLGFINERA
ncbi:arsenate reductase (glutaredoxin) [Flavipsychrobacter stenotrophus]|uniref:Arsenate reductase (Glutaredoxin) n=1 Tax=Flavipsychrobacter stenotrophus TaxID=2077091 RepID=A0A2S7SV16_9BACT|nr:ArsC/Spx/MgsR family protein [Flavipsychrobacter stenotrophus]PQJ10584.1 arsenate reductase (glutaredoxin) [Flavipsychrobacter stenotrophus]